MRYANFRDHGATSINYGDYLQFIVIDRLYEKMGIPSSDIYYISGYEVDTYQGETLLLPFNFVSSIMIKKNRLAISKDIVPVFLGFSFSSVKEEFDPDLFFEDAENRSYFMKSAPIGCRDEYTYQIFCRYGIPAYLNGCLTATIPVRQESGKQNKVIFADTPQALLPYIPTAFFENCEFVTQQSCFTKEEIGDYRKIFAFIKEKYEYYRENSALVVTSRLHVAVPCTAMGIPVIFAKDYIDTRFSWLEKLIPLYSLNTYENIDWAPKQILYESMKEKLVQMAILRIKSVFETYQNAEQIHPFYQTRNAIKAYYNSHQITHKNTIRVKNFIESNLPQNLDKIPYVLWGITHNAEFWADYIESQCPRAELQVGIDTYQQGEFRGLRIEKPEYLANRKECYIFVLAVSAANDAIYLFKKYGIPENHYCIAADTFLYNLPDRAGGEKQ